MTMNFNVFTAAAQAGLERVARASSETTLGLPFDVPPRYAPVDEVFADVTLTREVGEFGTPLAIDRARAALNFVPQRSWRDHAAPGSS
jgi:hypothetical protein